MAVFYNTGLVPALDSLLYLYDVRSPKSYVSPDLMQSVINPEPNSDLVITGSTVNVVDQRIYLDPNRITTAKIIAAGMNAYPAISVVVALSNNVTTDGGIMSLTNNGNQTYQATDIITQIIDSALQLANGSRSYTTPTYTAAQFSDITDDTTLKRVIGSSTDGIVYAAEQTTDITEDETLQQVHNVQLYDFAPELSLSVSAASGGVYANFVSGTTQKSLGASNFGESPKMCATAIFRKTLGQPSISLYGNDVLVGNSTVNAESVSFPNEDIYMFSLDGKTNLADYDIQTIYIYGRELTQQEVSQLYQATCA